MDSGFVGSEKRKKGRPLIAWKGNPLPLPTSQRSGLQSRWGGGVDGFNGVRVEIWAVRGSRGPVVGATDPGTTLSLL